MTAGQDARAQIAAPQINRLINTWSGRNGLRFGDAAMAQLRDGILSLMSEARDQGARDGARWVDGEPPRDGHQYVCLTPGFRGPVMLNWSMTAEHGDGWYDWMLDNPYTVTRHIILPPENAPAPHPDELTALSQEMGLYDTPGTALAPLREAEPRAMPVNRFTGLACDHAYIRRDPHSTAITWVCDLCGNKLAALSSAQGSTTEGRK